MANATIVVNSFGRSNVAMNTVDVLVVTVTAVATTYATATDGLPIDLTTSLQIAAPAGNDAPNYTQARNPNDVVGGFGIQMSTNGFLPNNLQIGTASIGPSGPPTYTAVPWETSTNAAAVPGILATCPATIRLWGTGNGNGLHFAEVADGSITDTFTFLLVIARSGANN
jgi:hypothetical protein